MNTYLEHIDLINMVCGVTPSSVLECKVYEDRGLMIFRGNQHNQEWNWNRLALKKLSDIELHSIYLRHRNQ